MDYFFGSIVDGAKNMVTNIAGLEENQQTLMRKKEELTARESDVKSIISQAEEEQGKRPTEEAKLWLRNVEQFKGEVDNIINQISPSNIRFNARLAQTVASKIEEADSLLKRGQLPNGLLIDQPHRHGKEILFEPPPLCGQSTTERTMDKIMELLMKPEIRKIGVYGMGGVGKTTIMKNIYNKLAVVTNQQFDRIIWVTVSKDMDGITGLQNRIAQELGQDFFVELSSRCEGQVNRAALLLKKLKQLKRFLLVLDDLWEEVTLEEVGIPEPDRGENDCKIVVTTRLLSVCDFIETQENVEVKCLSEEEAWKLFVGKTGAHVLRVSEITPLARDVVRELRGLPLAIVTVGCAMRRKCDIREWRHTLKALRSPTTYSGTTGMEDKVFKFLRFSYDHLREEVQKCFLYCAFFPEDVKIDESQLIMYWIAEGYTMNYMSWGMFQKRRRLVEEYDGTWDWEAELDKGFKILQELKDACMLESVKDKAYMLELEIHGKEEKYVRMHDLIRDMAIKIMREGDLAYISKAGLGLTEFPEDAWEEGATKISLMRNEIGTLPNQLSCPNLSTLLLPHNPYLIVKRLCLPRSFFSGMLALQVLDLSFCGILQLPESLFDLTNLRALFLKGLYLAEIPSLAKLKQLRILDLEYSRIEKQPEGMEELVNLRYLNLSYTVALQFDDRPNFIRNLACLEVLLGDSSTLFNSSIGDISIEEIGSLKRLTTLSMKLDDFDLYRKAMEHIQWNTLVVFHIFVTSIRDNSIFPHSRRIYNHQKTVEISNFSSSGCIPDFRLPNQTEGFCIKFCMIPRFSSLFSCLKNLRSLKCLSISVVRLRHCRSGDCIVEMGEMEPNTLETLEELELDAIHQVEVIWGGAVTKGNLSFMNLKTLDVRRCTSLKTLFSYEILQHLKNIEIIFAVGCPQMDQIECSEIVDGESEMLGDTNTSSASTATVATNDQIIVVPKLRILFLHDLPLLRYVSKRVWVCNSLEHLGVFGCPRLKKLPFQSLPPPVNIHGESEWWEETLQWDSAEQKFLFQSYFKEGRDGLFEEVPEVRYHNA